jgi:hypothetical protein
MKNTHSRQLRTGAVWELVGGGGEVEKGRVNMMQILCAHVYKRESET